MARKRGRCAYCGKPDVSLLEAFTPELAAEHKSNCLWVGSKGNALVPKPKPRRRPSDSERLTWLLRLLREICPDRQFTRRGVDRLMREEAKK